MLIAVSFYIGCPLPHPLRLCVDTFSATSYLIRVSRASFVSEIFGDLLTGQQSEHQAELLVLAPDPLISA